MTKLNGAVADTESRTNEYQQLKAKVHQELLNRLNLERLTRVKREDAEPEIRRVIGTIIENQLATTPQRQVLGQPAGPGGNTPRVLE